MDQVKSRLQFGCSGLTRVGMPLTSRIGCEFLLPRLPVARGTGMRAWGLHTKRICAAAALVVRMLGGCAANSYMGIPLDTAGATGADAALRNLAACSRAGDKHAQLELELGIAFEEGRGVPRDLDKAEKLYRLAATDSAGSRQVYVPPTGRGAGSILIIKDGIPSPGLSEARGRLSALTTVRRSPLRLRSSESGGVEQ